MAHASPAAEALKRIAELYAVESDIRSRPPAERLQARTTRPTGGIKEQALAAKHAGVADVILPEDNRQNVHEDLTPGNNAKSIPRLWH